MLSWNKFSNKFSSWVRDVMIPVFCDFRQFSAKKLAFFSKTNVMINFFHNLALFWVKNANLCRFFWPKYSKNHITSVPGYFHGVKRWKIITFLLPAMLSQGCPKATWISQTWLFALCRQLYPNYKVRIGCSHTPSNHRLYFLTNVFDVYWVVNNRVCCPTKLLFDLNCCLLFCTASCLGVLSFHYFH
jgi:hypothetical protein